MTLPENESPPEGKPLDLSDIDTGLEAVRGKAKPDNFDILEASSLDDEMLREKIKNLRSDRQLREKYADRILAFLESYAVLVFVLVVLDAIWPTFDIPENAVVTLVGSTAIAAIGLVGFVAKGLFK